LGVTDQKIGVLLLNLGTPDSPTTSDVRRYLREFLSDPRVIDTHPITRALLLNLVILPFRPKRSAEAYQKVWTPDGSPLLVESRALTTGVADALGGDFHVVLGMRYGEPSIGAALDALLNEQPTQIVVVPLFPQYADASTGSALARVNELLPANAPELTSVPPFYDEPRFIGAWEAVARDSLAEFPADHVLFSYHGLPERQVRRTDETGAHCFERPDCCDKIVAANRNCYRAQCLATSNALAAALGLEEDGWSMSFQSRLGRTPWIRPFTDEWVEELAQRGHRRLAVMCPAFVADCLETLEEVGIRLREQWISLGGEDLLLVPSLNAHPLWADTVANLVRVHSLAGQ
jgi:ferrochelatase